MKPKLTIIEQIMALWLATGFISDWYEVLKDRHIKRTMKNLHEREKDGEDMNEVLEYEIRRFENEKTKYNSTD